ncbi:MAG: dockerin type I repeat-containing protein [Oscillospiraceae bacterium]
MKKTIAALLSFLLIYGVAVSGNSTSFSNDKSDRIFASDSSAGTDPVRVRYQYLLTRGREEVLKQFPMFDYFPDMIGFDIMDITGDGTENLILRRVDESIIYIFDTEKNVLGEFPERSVFYSNGTVAVQLKNASALNGKFSPYTVYKFDSEINKYSEIGTVEAWDKSAYPTNSSGSSYPDDIDTSQSGRVYYISADGYDANSPVDVTVYNKWKASWINDASQVKFTFSDLTQKNIDNIDTSIKVVTTTSATVTTAAPESTAAQTTASVTTTVPQTTASETSSTTVATTAPETSATAVTTTAPETSATTVTTTAPETSATTVITTTPETSATTVTTTVPETSATTVTTTAPETSATTVTTTTPETSATTVTTTTPETSATTVTTAAVTTEPDFMNSKYDINKDGIISTADFVRLVQIIINPEKYQLSSVHGDLNFNGTVASDDLILMKRFLKR